MSVSEEELSEKEVEKRMAEYVQAHWPEIKHDLLNIRAAMKEYENEQDESSSAMTRIEKHSI